MFQRNHFSVSLQTGCADSVAIPFSSAQISRLEDQQVVGILEVVELGAWKEVPKLPILEEEGVEETT